VLISSRIDLSAVRSGNANYGRVLAETQWFVQDFQFTWRISEATACFCLAQPKDNTRAYVAHR